MFSSLLCPVVYTKWYINFPKMVILLAIKLCVMKNMHKLENTSHTTVAIMSII